MLTSFGIYLGTDSTAGFTYLAFGPFVGPHVAFAGGVGAAAYAGRRGYADSKDATTPLAHLGKPDVLWVGAAFGVFGYVVQNLITKIPWFGTHTNSVALTVVLSARVLDPQFQGQTKEQRSAHRHHRRLRQRQVHPGL